MPCKEAEMLLRAYPEWGCISHRVSKSVPH